MRRIDAIALISAFFVSGLVVYFLLKVIDKSFHTGLLKPF